MRINIYLVSGLVCSFALGWSRPGAATEPWSPPTSAAIAARVAKLDPDQFRVTQRDGTEPPFKNAYWDNHAEGLYVDVVSGQPLFSSRDKYDSGTGWPSFTRTVQDGVTVEKPDRGMWGARTEIRGALSHAHLGHVFDDGPKPTGKRYCMNSAALRFVPKARLEAEGYAALAKIFAEKP